MSNNEQHIINMLTPYLANPNLVFGGGYYSKSIITAQNIIDVLASNPDLDLGSVKVKQTPLIEEFMDQVGRLSNWTVARAETGAGACDEINSIGIAMINQHGCDPWISGIPKTMSVINAITRMEHPPMKFVRAVMQHPCAPVPREIEKAAEHFATNRSIEHLREQNPVHHACSQNQTQVLGFWLELGFGTEGRDAKGNIPIALAISPEVARILLEAGSPITRVDAQGRGAIDAWSATTSASVKDLMAKEVSRAIDQGLVKVNRDLLVDMACNDTARRKLEEMMKSSGIGWWDPHGDGSVARLAIVDMLARYETVPKFVQTRMASLVTSAHECARREKIDLDGFDRDLLRVAGRLIGLDKIKAGDLGQDGDTAKDVFAAVLERVPGDQTMILRHAQLWSGEGLMDDANAVDVLLRILPWYREKIVTRAATVSSSFQPEYGDSTKSRLGIFVHKTLPEMLLRMAPQDQARALPAMAILSNDALRQSGKPGAFGSEESAEGGINQAILSMDRQAIAPHLDNQAMDEAIDFIKAHERLFSAAGPGFRAFLSAQTMASSVIEPSAESSPTRGPRF